MPSVILPDSQGALRFYHLHGDLLVLQYFQYEFLGHRIMSLLNIYPVEPGLNDLCMQPWLLFIKTYISFKYL